MIKRIHNKSNHTYYAVRQRSNSSGKTKGQIIGHWSSKKN